MLDHAQAPWDGQAGRGVRPTSAPPLACMIGRAIPQNFLNMASILTAISPFESGDRGLSNGEIAVKIKAILRELCRTLNMTLSARAGPDPSRAGPGAALFTV